MPDTNSPETQNPILTYIWKSRIIGTTKTLPNMGMFTRLHQTNKKGVYENGKENRNGQRL